MALNCWVAKVLRTSEVSDHSTQAMHGIYRVKTRFVTLLSTKLLNNIENIVILAEKSFSWSSTKPFVLPLRGLLEAS